MRWPLTAIAVSILSLPAAPAAAQDPARAPITAAQRAQWIGQSLYGPRSLAAGVFVAGFQTEAVLPEEWGRSADGFARRFGARDAAIATSNSIEAALGAAWGEDPRYFACGCSSVTHRAGHAAKLAFVARRDDGRFAPAWGRYAGTMTASVVQNAWLPPSVTQWQDVVIREGTSFGGRFVGNLWAEFWPDVKRRLHR